MARQKNVITGNRLLDIKLAGMHARIQKKLARRASRAAVKEIVLPEAKRLVPTDTGALEASLKVRAIKRTKTRIGHTVQTVGLDKPRQAPSIEFGTERMTADPFLRRALYTNENAIRGKFIFELNRALIEERVKVRT